MEHNPYESPQAQGNESPQIQGNVWPWDIRATLVTCIYLFAMIFGVTKAIRPENAALALLLGVTIALSVTNWCVVDARTIGRPIVQSLHWIMFCTWPIAAPAYLIFSRKLRGLGIAIAHAVGLLITIGLAFHLTGYIAYGNIWLRQFHH
jgi:hypothetical protein